MIVLFSVFVCFSGQIVDCLESFVVLSVGYFPFRIENHQNQKEYIHMYIKQSIVRGHSAKTELTNPKIYSTAVPI